MIEVFATAQLEATDAVKNALANGAADDIARRYAEDATFGTYDDLPKHIRELPWDRPPTSLATADVLNVRSDVHAFDFKLCLAEEVFPTAQGGLQHLVGVLSGDTFGRRFPATPVKSVRVNHVEFGKDYLVDAAKLFRATANSISQIRQHFKLGSKEALKAFSFKPRMGLPFSEFKRLALDVANAGFHIIEPDTRNLQLTLRHLSDFILLAEEIANIRSHTARLSLNVSLPSFLAIDYSLAFMTGSREPHVLKIDGGLDGLSTIQTLRTRPESKKFAPIITSYPLLSDVLSSRVPADGFVSMLAASGADIIYPGQVPKLGYDSGNQLFHGDPKSVKNAVQRYRNLSKSGYPMLTVAGGVYAGQLHAFYDLFGSDVAYFLGGAVALNTLSLEAGASVCIRALKAAEAQTRQGNGGLLDCPAALAQECEEAYGKSSRPQFRYVSADALDKLR